MMLCRNCGQNKHISEENFIAYQSIHGTETLYVSCEDCNEIVDYGDSNTDNDGIEEYQCPHCDGHDIDTDWEDEPEEIDNAQALRNNYDRRILGLAEKRRQEKIRNERWDE